MVTEIRKALVEYSATTFALSEERTARDALCDFLTRAWRGVFRSPYLRVRSTFQRVGADRRCPPEWLRADFTPYADQAASFARLTSGG